MTDHDALICGVDEAGRGPLAGPVYAAAVILDPARPVAGLADSKKLTPRQREALALEIRTRAVAWAVASASVEEIDSLNILQASLLAMRRAVEELAVTPQQVLVDGLHRPRLAVPVRAIVRGDATVAAIAAASILAKVARDGEMLIAAPAASPVRLRPPQGLSHERAPGGAARAWRLGRAPAQLCTGARAAGAEEATA